MFDDDNVNDEYQDDVEQDIDNEVIDDEQDVDDTDEQDNQDDTADSQDDDVLEFSFDEDDDDKDEFAGKPAPEWVKQVRQENRELKRQLKQRESQQEQQQALREKPTLDAHDYDSDAYEQDYAEWLSEKTQHDAKVQAEQQKYQQYDERYVNDVNAMKAKAPDYDEIEQSIVDALPTSKQAMLKMLVDNPAKMVYALGKSPNKLQALSELDDIQFAKQIVLMEQSMSTVKRNPNKPKPKSHSLEGAAGGGDTKLAKLEAEADRTNDRSKVIAYKRSQNK